MPLLGPQTHEHYLESPNYKNCPSCNGQVVYKIFKTYFYLFHVRTHLVEQKMFFQCTQCRKECIAEDIVTTEKEDVVILREDGAVITISETQNIDYRTISKYTDKSKVIPKMADNEIMVSTVVSIMTTLQLIIGNDLDLSDNEWYQRLCEVHSDKIEDIEKMNYLISIVSQEEAENISYNKLAQCKIPLKNTDLRFILHYSLKTLGQHQKLDDEVQRFYFRLFDVLGLQNLEKKNFFNGLLYH